MLQGKDESSVIIRMGVWSVTESEELSSNWRELANVVHTIRSEAETGKLYHAIIFLMTDNFTVEAAIMKGGSPSPHLHVLVRDMKMLQMKFCFAVHVTHSSGKRMIAQGTDGVSRGSLAPSTLLHKPIREFASLHISALDRCNNLHKWVRTWVGKDPFFLSPKQWFVEGHDIRFKKEKLGQRSMFYESSTYVWSPPPAAAKVALEQLRYARIKRQRSIHVFLIPRLFYGIWREQLYKSMDLILIVPPHLSCWPEEMFEPLILAFCFPFSRYEPWCIKDTPKLHSLARALQKMWKEDRVAGGDNLREFLLVARKIPILSEHVVRSLLYFK